MRKGFPDRLNLRVGNRVPCLPPGLRIYTIGDIHGRADLLDKLLSLIDRDLQQLPVIRSVCVFLGDYIDRGPSSRETIDRLIEHGATHEAVFLKGNHESIALNFLSNRATFDTWARLGGVSTLVSYGLTPGTAQTSETQQAFHNALPASHLRFFRDLGKSFACGDFFFAHAGAKPNVQLKRQKESDLLWIRDEFLSSDHDFGKIIIHGHTPALEVEVRPNRINIDTGAFATGRLTCLVIEADQLSLIDTSAT